MLNIHLEATTGLFIIQGQISKSRAKELKAAPFKTNDLVGTLSSLVRGTVEYPKRHQAIEGMALMLMAKLDIRQGSYKLFFADDGTITVDELKLS